MLTGRQLIGLAVRERTSGKLLGRVSNVLVNLESGQVRGFAVSSGSWLPRTLFLPASAVESVSPQGLLAEAQALKPGRSQDSVSDSWRGSLLKTSSGEPLGVISDLVLDEGRIAGLEISGGVLADAKGRRSLVAWDSLQADRSGGFIHQPRTGGGELR